MILFGFSPRQAKLRGFPHLLSQDIFNNADSISQIYAFVKGKSKNIFLKFLLFLLTNIYCMRYNNYANYFEFCFFSCFFYLS